MPAEDVSDLRDVVDAINKLCETMKTSNYDDEPYEDCLVTMEPVEVTPYVFARDAADAPHYIDCGSELISPEEVSVQKVEAHRAERWSDSLISLPGQVEDLETVTSDTEPAIAQFETVSEMYYTASSEVSLLSDIESVDRPAADEESSAEAAEGAEARDERQECVMAGHVAAMRERFENMTRANTPCPDLMRSMSPSLDVFTNIISSPDHLG